MEAFLAENDAVILFVGMMAALVVAASLEAIFPRRPEAPVTNWRWLNNVSLAVINQINTDWFNIGVT
ncbi:MAG: hypothetical protein LJE84_05525, partial [Gammaproteobacteria bacterium]|nr:hypothetical protein [Gammaproteobacteria bacterium]